MKTREEAMQKLIEGSFNLQLNMNDTFAWGCSDVEEIDADDAMDLVKYIQKYDYYAIDAYVSAKRELFSQGLMHPMVTQDAYKSYCEKRFGAEALEEKRDNYFKAREEIKAAILSGEDFSSLNYEIKRIQEDEKEFGEEVKWKGIQLPGQTYYTQIAFLTKKGLSGTGTNMKEARENLRLSFDRAQAEAESKK